MVGSLWAQYQSAIAMGASNSMKLDAHSTTNGGLSSAIAAAQMPTASAGVSPSRTEPPLSSPNTLENPDESSSSGHKDDDDGSEDDSDDRLDTNTPHDPERLKAFNVSDPPALRMTA